MELRDGMCTGCIKNKQNPLLFSDANCLDPGSVPTNLPELSEMEEMLIAHVHVHQQIARVRDHQYQYTGLVCGFQHISYVNSVIPLARHAGAIPIHFKSALQYFGGTHHAE